MNYGPAKNFICFDLEGPLSPQDNAYELMTKLIPNGARIFEVISHYDDLLAVEGKKGYEPGETLALIVPFLIYHNISEDALRLLSESATLINGAHELVTGLINRGWWVGDITTSYEHYGYPITQRVGIPSGNVACTRFRLDSYRGAFRKEDLADIRQLEEDILKMPSTENDKSIKKRLDSFYWSKTANDNVRAIVKMIEPLGGRRKLHVLQTFANINHLSMDQLVVVGDSITDAKMLQEVEYKGGLAIAFNANEFALSCSSMSLASIYISDLMEILQVWEKEHRKGVEERVKEKEKIGGTNNRGYFHWLSGRKDIDEVIRIHERIRRLVRQEAGKLG